MAAQQCREFPRVSEVRAYVKKATGDQGADCHDVVDQHWINGYPTPIANPMSLYPRYHDYRKSWGINALGSVIVEVESEDGTVGVGVSIGGQPACYIVENHLSRFVEGQDPRNVELIWDQMYRSTLNYGRKGLPIQALSAVDLAMWDLLGKLRREPVFSLLGGKTKLAKALQPYNLKWIEECLPPDDYTGYAELSNALRGVTMVTTGEHEYTRYGYRQLLEGRCADILQPDVTWMGGLTEVSARRVVALASSYSTPVIPHGSSVYSYHLQYAFTSCPLAEFINLSPKADEIVPYFGGLFPDEPLPKDGYIDLSDRPGFGVSLDKTGLERPYPRSCDQVKGQCRANCEQLQAPHSTTARMPF